MDTIRLEEVLIKREPFFSELTQHILIILNSTTLILYKSQN